MRQSPQILPSWVVAEGSGSIQADAQTGVYRWAHGVRIIRSCNHEPVDAKPFGFGEVDVLCDVEGELQLKWERIGRGLGAPLCAPIQAGRRTVARFSLYAEPAWAGWINSVQITFPAAVSEGIIGPFRLLTFSDLEAGDLQRFARASATMEAVRDKGLRVSLRYNGVYLAPLDTSKWVQVSLHDESDREILSATKPARGNYDAPWIEADFLFPTVGEVAGAEVFLIDNQTGYSIACRAEPKMKREGWTS